MKSRPSKQRILYLRIFIVAIILTVTAGWILTDFLGRVAEQEFKEIVDRETKLAAFFLHDSLDDVTSAAKSLGPAEAIVAALSTNSPTDLDRANKLLDRIKSNFDMSVCYLLDRKGLTVASSNRNDKNGFVGISFAARPYFTGAVAGRLTTYFALGKISRERGYYASIPVIDSSGTITGVVVVKRNLAPVEVFFRKFTNVFLVSPEGIIFISSREGLLYRSLWPVDAKKRSDLLESRQFGNITFEPLLTAEPRAGSYVSFDNRKLYLQRLLFGSDGWTLVFMDQPRIVANYRLFGILLTCVFALLLLFFFNVLLNKEKSLEAAKKLLKSKDDWKRTFDTVPDLIAIIDSNHRITAMNRAMTERLGISPESVVGRRCYELLHGSTEPSACCPHQKMLVSGNIESEPLFHKILNGEFIVTAAPILAEDGTIESSVHVMHDVSNLKRLEQSLIEHAQRLEFVLEGSNDATWEWDLINDTAVVNAKFYELTEYPPGESDIDFAFFINTVHPDDVSEVHMRMKDHLDGKIGTYETHYRMITKSGKIRHVMARGKVVSRDDNGRPTKMAGVTTDFTEQKRLGDEISRIHNLESIGLLAGGLAHDFNNILNIIYGNITFAKMLAEGDSAISEPLADAEEACERAKELGTRLQGFSQDNSPIKVLVTLIAVIEDAAETLFKGSNILCTISAGNDLLPVEADPRQIRQVFENLLINAKEAMSDSGTVKIEIENCVVDGTKELPLCMGRYVCIVLQDDGKGIPEKNQPKIFDPYFSTKDTYSQRGMGLGLSICYAILKRHSGHICVESKEGIGTRVSLYLPATAEESPFLPETGSDDPAGENGPHRPDSCWSGL